MATELPRQVSHYTAHIKNNPAWEFAGVYADEGITGTNTKKRVEFNRMIEDCMAGKIDKIITKSISRFARNTLDTLKYVRQLKEKGIGIFFEKENVDTLDTINKMVMMHATKKRLRRRIWRRLLLEL
jgi:DNA invertase Pin-like site-specific DNA recombinase